MYTLTVRQKLHTGPCKEWKLKSNEGPYTFGTSRNSDLISLDNTIAGFVGLFEFVENTWWYIDLQPQAQSEKIRTPIEEKRILHFENFDLELISTLRTFNLYENLNQFQSHDSGSQKSYQLFIVKKSGQVLETKLLPFGKKFKKSFGANEPIVVEPQKSQNWVNQNIADLDISQRTISLQTTDHLAQMTKNQVIDESSQKGLYIVMSFALLIFSLALFGPKKQNETLAFTKPVTVQNIVIKNELKKNRSTTASAKKYQVQPPVAIQPPAAAGSPQVSKFKNFNTGRLSQLLSKVSSQAAKSATLIVSQGVKAGEGPSGRALAAIGKVDTNGKDWSSDSQGSNIKISTQGVGGGNSVSGKGVLKAGSTGSAGVGLIEDESEIVGGLDREVIAEYIKTQLGQILYCYERQLSANPDLFGKISVKFTIGGNGKVERQLIGDSTLKNATVEGCILNRVAAWKFPAPQGGTQVLVTYPFLFKSTN
ncbi:MAG: AgmX/PglI C-terminal domain-containing protein [Pseudobdellovibrionaceae bacterium]